MVNAPRIGTPVAKDRAKGGLGVYMWGVPMIKQVNNRIWNGINYLNQKYTTGFTHWVLVNFMREKAHLC